MKKLGFIIAAAVVLAGGFFVCLWASWCGPSGDWLYRTYAGQVYVYTKAVDPTKWIDRDGSVKTGKFVISGLRSSDERWDILIDIPNGADPRKYSPSASLLREKLRANGLDLSDVSDEALAKRYPPVSKQ